MAARIKLSRRKIAAMLAMREGGASFRTIGEAYGMSRDRARHYLLTVGGLREVSPWSHANRRNPFFAAARSAAVREGKRRKRDAAM